MDDRTLLRSRIASLGRAVERAWPPTDEELDPTLADRVVARLDLLAESEHRNLTELDALVTSGHALERCWRGYSALALSCVPLFEECLAVRQGGLARRAELDDGLCALADALLTDVSLRADVAWPRFTVLGSGDAYTRLSDIVRLRFPELSLWDLPVAVHELGHFVARKLESQGVAQARLPFAELEARLRKTGGDARLLEHFADAFAVVTVGPAYVATSLLLRLDPGPQHAAQTSETHPTDAQRAEVMLAVLRKLGQDSDVASGLVADARELEAIWSRVQRSAGGRGDAGQDADPSGTAADLAALLCRHLPARARYTADVHERAAALGRALADPAVAVAPSPGDRLVHVLNGAWRARLAAQGDPYAVDRITRAARRLLDGIAGAMRPAGVVP
jgi:hypothetical protein